MTEHAYECQCVCVCVCLMKWDFYSLSLSLSQPKPSISSVSDTLRRPATETGVARSFIDLGEDSEEEEEEEEEEVEVGRVESDGVPSRYNIMGTIRVRSHDPDNI